MVTMCTGYIYLGKNGNRCACLCGCVCALTAFKLILFVYKNITWRTLYQQKHTINGRALGERAHEYLMIILLLLLLGNKCIYTETYITIEISTHIL